MSDPTTQLFDTWRRQLEESTQAWTKLVGQVSPPATPPDPSGLASMRGRAA